MIEITYAVKDRQGGGRALVRTAFRAPAPPRAHAQIAGSAAQPGPKQGILRG
jgi:hypothetical protein